MANAEKLTDSNAPFRIEDSLHCPVCSGDLVGAGKTWQCKDGHTFPEVGKIPWIFKHPQAKVGEWRWHVELQLGQIETKVNQLKQEQALPDLMVSTKKRLARLIQAYQEHKKNLTQLLSPLGKIEGEVIKGSEAWTAKIPVTQSIVSYFENIHRDWSEAANEENRICAELVLNQCHRDRSHQRVLTLGAGGCRLSYDIHQHLPDAKSVALDINPLLFLSAKRILDGRGINLAEFPLHPLELDNVALNNKLPGVKDQARDFHLVFGDANEPPFKPGSFDLIITPWFVDIIPQDLRTLSQRINRLLKDGGRWVNFGPLGIRNPMFSRRYTKEEFEEAAQAAGFEQTTSEIEEIPYLKTPGAHSYRMEQVLVYAGDKVQNLQGELAPYRYLPDWLVDHTLPVPVTQALQQFVLQHEAFYMMGRLLDGRRSITEMGAEMAKNFRMTEEQGRESVVNVLTQVTEGHGFKHD